MQKIRSGVRLSVVLSMLIFFPESGIAQKASSAATGSAQTVRKLAALDSAITNAKTGVAGARQRDREIEQAILDAEKGYADSMNTFVKTLAPLGEVIAARQDSLGRLLAEKKTLQADSGAMARSRVQVRDSLHRLALAYRKTAAAQLQAEAPLAAQRTKAVNALQAQEKRMPKKSEEKKGVAADTMGDTLRKTAGGVPDSLTKASDTAKSADSPELIAAQKAIAHIDSLILTQHEAVKTAQALCEKIALDSIAAQQLIESRLVEIKNKLSTQDIAIIAAENTLSKIASMAQDLRKDSTAIVRKREAARTALASRKALSARDLSAKESALAVLEHKRETIVTAITGDQHHLDSLISVAQKTFTDLLMRREKARSDSVEVAAAMGESEQLLVRTRAAKDSLTKVRKEFLAQLELSLQNNAAKEKEVIGARAQNEVRFLTAQRALMSSDSMAARQKQVLADLTAQRQTLAVEIPSPALPEVAPAPPVPQPQPPAPAPAPPALVYDGQVSISTLPPQAQVFMDGVLIGISNTKALKIASGERTVQFVRGTLKCTQKVTFTPGINLTIFQKLPCN